MIAIRRESYRERERKNLEKRRASFISIRLSVIASNRSFVRSSVRLFDRIKYSTGSFDFHASPSFTRDNNDTLVSLLSQNVADICIFQIRGIEDDHKSRRHCVAARDKSSPPIFLSLSYICKISSYRSYTLAK